MWHRRLGGFVCRQTCGLELIRDRVYQHHRGRRVFRWQPFRSHYDCLVSLFEFSRDIACWLQSVVSTSIDWLFSILTILTLQEAPASREEALRSSSWRDSSAARIDAPSGVRHRILYSLGRPLHVRWPMVPLTV